MSSDQDNEVNARTLELLTRLLGENDLDALLNTYAKGDLTEDQIVTELAVRYQRGIGSAVRALAEHNQSAAKQLGERLRNRIEEFLSSLPDRGTPKPDDRPRQVVASMETFKDRDDAVLQREYVILKALAGRNGSLRSATIFDVVRSVVDGVQDEAITAHLGRMVKAGVIGRARKGRYNAVAQGDTHLQGLTSEIEARGLPLPALPDRIAED